ncbi:MAG: TRAP transporter fused permease subunit [Victivallales bacterium]|nr:TRAP transporter fused permease subunit [Victivallales bacterium]
MSEQEKDTISTENLDDVMRKYDKESNIRVWTGWPEKVVSVLLALFSVYCIYMTLVSTALPEIRLSLFLCFITLAGYLVFPARRKHVRPNYMPWFDIVLAFVGGGCFLYHAMDAMRIIKMMGRIGPWQIAAGVVGLICLAELCRRCVGVPILVVAGLLLGYTFYNKLSYGMPFAIALRDIVNTLFYSPSGVIGTPVNVCFTYIVLFIIFGAFLERTGIAGFFIAFANRIAGRSSGGPAKVAVISSALCGMVSGSSVGNTVTTGAITIPMMKKTGYKPEFAGAVEAAASTGGQIMPPIMGAAAFLMAEYMGLPYAQVALKAIIPALLYFTGIFIAVHLEAKALNLKGISALELPKWGFLLRNCYLILPLVLLIWLVSTGARTMAFSAAISIIAAFVVGFINHLFTEYAAHKDEKFAQTAKRSVVDSGMNAFDALVAGSKGAITVAVACAVAGVIAGCITTTGLASILINTIVRLAGNATVIGLVLTMLCCIVLGMGVPTTANYCIMASTCAPILIQLGFPAVAAHFFVFYFGIVADITPPVALAAFAGSAIAKANPMKTGLNATKLAIAAFIVPYIFSYNPALLLENMTGSGWSVFLQTMLIVVSAMLGLFGVGVALNGHLFRRVNPFIRILFAAGGLLMIVPGLKTDAVGLAIVAAMVAMQLINHRKE